MTVKELIEALQGFPPDYKVEIVCTYDSGMGVTAGGIETVQNLYGSCVITCEGDL